MSSEDNPIVNIFNSCPDTTAVEFFSNSKYVGLEIQVSRVGWGFGAITLSHNLEEGTWLLDDECTSRERVCQFLHDAVPQIVEALYKQGNVKFVPKEDDTGWLTLENPSHEEFESDVECAEVDPRK